MSEALLPAWDDRLPWKRTVGAITATEILRGSDETGLVVVAGGAPGQPTKTDLRGLWRARSGGGVMPVLVAVTYGHGQERSVSLLGLDDDAVPVAGVEMSFADQLIQDALNATSPSGLHAEVTRRLASLFGGIASGLRNEGLFAAHVLEQQPDQAGWADLCAWAKPVLGQRGEQLLGRLGFTIEVVPDGSVLRETTGGHRRAAAVLLSAGESFENPLSRLRNTNAVTHGLALARRENLRWLVVLGGPAVRLYPVSPDVGVGRKGQTQTYLELDLSLLTSSRSGYLPLLLAPGSFADGGALGRLLNESSQYATGLSERLRDRIYVDVVPSLAVAVADRRNVAARPASEQNDALDEAYHQTMILLFRLLFVAYAEDRGLLPYGKSERYTRNALKTLAMDFARDPNQRFAAAATTLWDDLTQVWKVIDSGDIEGWGVPSYNGGLFTRDAIKNPAGAATYALDLTNDQVGPALRGLLVDMTAEGVLGPVDFRSLSVREFGTIYEGLLESGLGIADTDLMLDENETYVPAEPGDPVKVPAGQVYFHSRSGSRKATGSYFTKPFAVEHLLDSSLEPSLDDHLARVKKLLDAGGAKTAAEALFDFRVTDLSMGSGHFLIASVDRIEARFSAFLAENPLPEVAVELHALRTAASAQLNLDPIDSGIDDGALLRRQIARRCIYGVDINEIAVELARLAVWIHTFIPGLPLSFLDHGLIWGNSLTGVGTLTEIGQALADAERRELKKKNAAQTSGLDFALEEFLERASQHLADLGALSDANVGDIAAATALQAQLERALAPLSALCDLITAERSTRDLKVGDPRKVRLAEAPALFTAITAEHLEAAILKHPRLKLARELATTTLMAAHMPVRFPEVFRREQPGFDCILGNPPWDKVRHEPQQFWVTVSPGLNALPDDAREAAIADLRRSRPSDAAREAEEIAWRSVQRDLFKASFTWRGGTHVELAQLVLERAMRITRPSGRLGLVLPRQFTVLAGWGKLRDVLTQQHDLTLVQGRNQNEWIFEGIDPRYAVVLVSAARSADPHTLLSVATSAEDIANWSAESSIRLSAQDIRCLSGTYVLPWFGSLDERMVFDRMVNAPKLAGLKGWITGHHDARWDFRGTGPDNALTTRTQSLKSWRVLMTAHVDAFTFDAGEKYKQYVDDMDGLIAKGRGVGRNDHGQPVLERSHPLIALRHPSRSDDSRTLIATALPEAGILHNKGYVHAVATDTEANSTQVLALLGYLNTFVADWWARRFVDRHITAPVINQLALPAWDDTQIAEAATITGSLLARGGASRLVGGVEVEDSAPALSAEELFARLNRLALDGFSLDSTTLEIMLNDFSPKGVSATLRARVAATFMPPVPVEALQ